MTLVTLICPDGSTRQLEVRPGHSLMRTAVSQRVPGIEGECGGCLTCATCHVYVEAAPASLPAASAEELDMLGYTAAERRPGSRLSCQIVGHADLPSLTVRIPDTQY